MLFQAVTPAFPGSKSYVDNAAADKQSQYNGGIAPACFFYGDKKLKLKCLLRKALIIRRVLSNIWPYNHVYRNYTVLDNQRCN